MSETLRKLEQASRDRLARLQEIPPTLIKFPSTERCLHLVCDNFKIKAGKMFFPIKRTEVLSSSRRGHVTLARQIAMYLVRKSSRLSTTQIGRAFGRNHATVLHSITKIEAMVQRSPKIKEEIDRLLQCIEESKPCSSSPRGSAQPTSSA